MFPLVVKVLAVILWMLLFARQGMMLGGVLWKLQHGALKKEMAYKSLAITSITILIGIVLAMVLGDFVALPLRLALIGLAVGAGAVLGLKVASSEASETS